jgi:cell wall-associated NlpC family hydrolase
VAHVGAPTAAAQIAVNTALAQLGDAYVWAGAGPNAFDCSGLTRFAYATAGVALPHSSGMQSRIGTPVRRADLQPGDLVFFHSPVSHVGMYIGNGQMVHAPTTGDVVRIANVDAVRGFTSARRLR